MYNIKSVSKMLEIPATTIRAWEMRYGAITPIRTKSGYRIYTEKDIADLKWLKHQSDDQGLSISQAVHLLQERKVNEQSDSAQNAQLKRSPDMSYQQMSDELFEALCDFQLDEANRILELGFSMYRYDDLFHYTVAPLMKHVGQQWVDHQLTIAQEHFITQFVTQRFYQFFRMFPVDPNLPKVLAFCPPSEYHQVGLLLFTLFLRQHAMEVIYLGPDTPLDGLDTLIIRKSIGVVCVSLTNPQHLQECQTVLKQLTDEFPFVQILLGGQGFAGHELATNQKMLGVTRDNWEQWFQQDVRKMR